MTTLEVGCRFPISKVVGDIIKRGAGHDKRFSQDQPRLGMPITSERLADELKLPLTVDPNSIKRLIALLKAEGLVSDDERT